jgi:hypothetical protein
LILVELTAAVDDGGVGRTFYLSTEGFVTGPADTPADTVFEPRLRDAGSIGVSLFGARRTRGSSDLQVGALKVINNDRALDAWDDYSFDGRPVVIRIGTGGAYPAAFTTLFAGTVDGVEAGIDSIVIKLRDTARVLSDPVLTVRFAGTNIGPVGLEGTADDLKGSVKPEVFGKVFNILPRCVNTSELVYLVSNSPLGEITEVYDQGVPLTFGVDHGSSSALIAATIASGHYDTCLAEGLFRLGSSPVGEVTANAASGPDDTERTVAQLLRALATRAGSIVADDDVSRLDFVTLRPDESPQPVGIYLSDETSYRDAMDALAASLGVWWAFDTSSVLRMGQLQAPAQGMSAGDIIESEILQGFERQLADGSAAPVWRVTVRYRKFWTTQTTGLAGDVDPPRRAALALEYRSVTAEDASVKVKNLLARELTVDTLLIEEADAQAEADRLLALYRTPRRCYDVPVTQDVFAASQARLGGQVALYHSRYGLAAGRDLVVLGYDLSRQKAVLSLWG